MGAIRDEPLVMYVVAAFSRDESLLDRTIQLLVEEFGPIAVRGPRFAFDHTNYYAKSMGEGLWKQLFGFEGLKSPAFLPARKRWCNDLEEKLAAEFAHVASRPINLDPGYLDQAKLVLASTKDHAHRLYLGEGIFGEITLTYREGKWRPNPWTYPDYQGPHADEFLNQARAWYREKLNREQLL